MSFGYCGDWDKVSMSLWLDGRHERLRGFRSYSLSSCVDIKLTRSMMFFMHKQFSVPGMY